MTRLDAIKVREQAATKGPWSQTRDLKYGVAIWGTNRRSLFRSDAGVDDSVIGADGMTQWQHDCDFVRHGRSDIPWLLAQVEALAGALRQIDDIAAAHCRGAIGDAQYVARTALAALEAPE